MSTTSPAGQALAPADLETLRVAGATIRFLVAPTEHEPFALLGELPPGAAVPLHRHDEPETFYELGGHTEALVERDGVLEWLPFPRGHVLHVPAGVKHAFRNPGGEPAVHITVTTARMGRFFRDAGLPAAEAPTGPPTAAELDRLVHTAARYGFWLADADENAAAGIELP